MVILHQQGEDGAAIPSLEAPVNVVKGAVTNLAKVNGLLLAHMQLCISLQFANWYHRVDLTPFCTLK